jgi:type VI secretion system protein ImpL
MKQVLGWLFNRWTLSALGLLLLALLVWIVGPLVAIAEVRPLDSERARWLTILLLFALVFGLLAWQTWRSRRANQTVVEQLVQAPAGTPAESPDMVALRERFERALQVLRKARFRADAPAAGARGGQPAREGLFSRWSARLGGRYLYELPWYMFIGAPGSGKTTALMNAGLRFPLADLTGEHRMRGVGGTRDCDWWFTDRAVLIDTAGRFVTQDSDATRDQGAWSGFLALLRKSRPRQPINGVLVTVCVRDLLEGSAADRDIYAGHVRQRLQELHQHLGVHPPIYLLVTKADMLSGFSDYFGAIDKDTRTTPWGYTLPLAQARQGDLSALAGELQALTSRLYDGLVERLQAETDVQRRARIYGFPLQFSSLHEPLIDFMRHAFAPSAFEEQALLRGVYFVSGTQEGTPIDRLMGSIARSLQLERSILPPQQAQARSYFIERLLGEVVFAEAGLVGTGAVWERRRRLGLIGATVVLALLTLGTLSAWTVSALNNSRYVEEVRRQTEAVRQLVQTTPAQTGSDLLPLLPALAATRDLAQAGRSGPDIPWSLGFGLYQGAKLGAASHSAYERMLVDAVLPRLSLRIEEQLRQRSDAPELLYESLKAYLMLHEPKHFDVAALSKLVRADWEQNLPRSIGTEPRQQLDAHLAALLAIGPAVSPLPIDQPLIAQTRARLASVPLAQRIYTRLRQQARGEPGAEFTVQRTSGPVGPLVFARVSGEPLDRGVPQLYTRDGYLQGFQRKVDAVTRELADEEGWVLGTTAEPQRANADVANQVRRLYLNEYARTWDAFVADVRLRPTSGLAELNQVVLLMAGPDNPIGTFLKAVVRETTLMGGGEDIPGKGKALIDRALGGAVESVRSLANEIKPGSAATDRERLESIVDDRFAPLRRYVMAPPGGKAPLDDTLVLLKQVQEYLTSVDLATRGGGQPPPSDIQVRLAAEGARAAEPVRSVLASIGKSGTGFTGVIQRETLAREVKTVIGDFCNQAVAGRYPQVASGTADITLADFASLFGPGGRFERLFQDKLATYVDTSARPHWRFRAGTLGDDAGSLPQFQRAQAIRETFFPGGSTTPTIQLELKPVEMDASITQFTLDVDGQVVRYAHGPQIPTTVKWPGPGHSNQVRLQLNPPGASGSGLLHEGPWALLHLFDRVRIEPGRSPERFRATFEVDGRKAVFEVTASSVRNPLRLRELYDFSCPGGL